MLNSDNDFADAPTCVSGLWAVVDRPLLAGMCLIETGTATAALSHVPAIGFIAPNWRTRPKPVNCLSPIQTFDDYEPPWKSRIREYLINLALHFDKLFFCH